MARVQRVEPSQAFRGRGVMGRVGETALLLILLVILLPLWQ
jgi:hypothetical protein